MRRRFTPDPDGLYSTDNGAIRCGRHLGASAAMTGRDISGLRIARLTDADIAAIRSEVADGGGSADLVGCQTCLHAKRR